MVVKNGDNNSVKVKKPKSVNKLTKKNSELKSNHSLSKTEIKKGIVYNEKIFIENFINLQHAMTNLSIKFSELSQNISNLLGVFEEAAKTLAKSEKQVDGQIVNKIDSLLEQNKTIAKGLVLMEDQFKRQARFSPSATTPNPFESSKQNTMPPQIQRNFNSHQYQDINRNQSQPNGVVNNIEGFQQNSDRPKPLPQL